MHITTTCPLCTWQTHPLPKGVTRHTYCNVFLTETRSTQSINKVFAPYFPALLDFCCPCIPCHKASPLHPPQEAETWLLSQFKLHKGMTRYGRFDICYHLKGWFATSASSSGRFDICNSIHTFEDHEVHVTVLFPMKRVRFFCRGTWMFCAMHRAIFPFPLKSAESNAQLHGCFGPVTFFFF